MTESLDCLVIGYNESSFSRLSSDLLARPASDPERSIFMRNHIVLEGERLPYMDAINNILTRNQRSGSEVYLNGGEVPNLAACYLASYLIKRGVSAEAIGLFNCDKERIEEVAISRHPKIVAITTTYYIMPYSVVEISDYIRQLMPDVTIVVGGPLIGNLVADHDQRELAEVFTWMGADIYVDDSQGEQTLLDIAQAMKAGTDLKTVPNVYLATGQGNFVYTTRRPELNPMDDCVIDWSLFASDGVGRTVHSRTARSCAFKCSFCDYPVRAGQLSLTSVEAVERELLQLERLGVEHMVFIDDTFNVPGPRFKELCRMMARNDFGFGWYSFFRAGTARDKETYDLMKASKCRAVFLGIESGDDEVLRNMSKVATIDRYRFGIEQLHERGILSFASFISGFPGETDDTVQRTIDFINETQPTFFRTEPWWYNHRSPIHLRAQEFGIVGREYRWSHKTMDIGGAVQACEALFRQVNGSLWMPAHNFDFWALPYLFGKGIGPREIIDFHKYARKLMEYNDTPEKYPAVTLQALLRALDDVPPVSSKYRRPATGPQR